MYPESIKRELVTKVVRDGYSIHGASREMNIPYGTAQVWVTQMGDTLRRQLKVEKKAEYDLSDCVKALNTIADELRTLNSILAEFEAPSFH